MIYSIMLSCCLMLSSCIQIYQLLAYGISSEEINPENENRATGNVNYDSIKSHLDELGQDNSILLNEREGEYFNILLEDRLNGFDFINKRILFLHGSCGNNIVDKQTVFNEVKDLLINNYTPSSVSMQFLVLSETLIQKTGYDVIVSLGMKKRLSAKHVMKILKKNI